MKLKIAALICLTVLTASAQLSTQTQQGAQFVISPDSNGNPQIVGYKLYKDANSTPSHLQIYGANVNTSVTGINRSTTGWIYQPLPNPAPLTPGTSYRVDSTYYLSAPAQTSPPPAPAVPLPSGYVLVFNDEFKQQNLNEFDNWGITRPGVVWEAHQPSGGNDLGLGWDGIWLNPPYRTNNLVEDVGGGLEMNEWWEPTLNNGAGHWISSLISTMDPAKHGFSQAFGYWECAMQSPPLLPGDAANTPGLWSSFWLLGANGIGTPGSDSNPVAEIDIFESYSVDYTKTHQTVHNWVSGGDKGFSAFMYSGTVDLSQAVHIYSCLVAPDYVHFYIDGVETFKTPTLVSDTYPLQARVDVAFGGGWPVSGLSTTGVYKGKVLYVRCWAKP
jgi:hypothetical protein